MGLPSSVTADGSGAREGSVVGEDFAHDPRVAAAMGKTRIWALRSGASIQRVISGESLTGMVLGMAQTEVNPPAAAAAVPVAMVSL